MKKLLLKLYFSGEDSDKFTEMITAHRVNPFLFKKVYEADKKRHRFEIEFTDERQIFHLGFLWKDKIQPYEEAAPF